MFWSDRWIALDRVPDLARSPVAQRLISETFSPERRAKWVLDGEVDGARAFEAKRHVLQSWIATRSDIMAELVNRRITTVLASLAAAVIIALNVFLIVQTVTGA